MRDIAMHRKINKMKKRWIGISIAVLGLGGASLMHAVHPVHADVVNTDTNPGDEAQQQTSTQAPQSRAPEQQTAAVQQSQAPISSVHPTVGQQAPQTTVQQSADPEPIEPEQAPQTQPESSVSSEPQYTGQTQTEPTSAQNGTSGASQSYQAPQSAAPQSTSVSVSANSQTDQNTYSYSREVPNSNVSVNAKSNAQDKSNGWTSVGTQRQSANNNETHHVNVTAPKLHLTNMLGASGLGGNSSMPGSMTVHETGDMRPTARGLYDHGVMEGHSGGHTYFGYCNDWSTPGPATALSYKYIGSPSIDQDKALLYAIDHGYSHTAQNLIVWHDPNDPGKHYGDAVTFRHFATLGAPSYAIDQARTAWDRRNQVTIPYGTPRCDVMKNVKDGGHTISWTYYISNCFNVHDAHIIYSLSGLPDAEIWIHGHKQSSNSGDTPINIALAPDDDGGSATITIHSPSQIISGNQGQTGAPNYDFEAQLVAPVSGNITMGYYKSKAYGYARQTLTMVKVNHSTVRKTLSATDSGSSAPVQPSSASSASDQPQPYVPTSYTPSSYAPSSTPAYIPSSASDQPQPSQQSEQSQSSAQSQGGGGSDSQGQSEDENQNESQGQTGGTVDQGGNGDSPANNPNNYAGNNSNPNNQDANNVVVPGGHSSNNNNLVPNGPVFNNNSDSSDDGDDSDNGTMDIIANDESRAEQDNLNRMTDSANAEKSKAAQSAATAASLSAVTVSAELSGKTAAQKADIINSANMQSLENEATAQQQQNSLANAASAAQQAFMNRVSVDHSQMNVYTNDFLGALGRMHDLTPQQRQNLLAQLHDIEVNYLSAINARNANDGALNTNLQARLNALEAKMKQEDSGDLSSEVGRTDSAIAMDTSYYTSLVNSKDLTSAQKQQLDNELSSLAADATSEVPNDDRNTAELNDLVDSLVDRDRSLADVGSAASVSDSNTSRNSEAQGMSSAIDALHGRIASEENSVNNNPNLNGSQKAEIDSALNSTEAAEEAAMRGQMKGTGNRSNVSPSASSTPTSMNMNTNSSNSSNVNNNQSSHNTNGFNYGMYGMYGEILPNGCYYGFGPYGFGLYAPNGQFLGNGATGLPNEYGYGLDSLLNARSDNSANFGNGSYISESSDTADYVSARGAANNRYDTGYDTFARRHGLREYKGINRYGLGDVHAGYGKEGFGLYNNHGQLVAYLAKNGRGFVPTNGTANNISRPLNAIGSGNVLYNNLGFSATNDNMAGNNIDSVLNNAGATANLNNTIHAHRVAVQNGGNGSIHDNANNGSLPQTNESTPNAIAEAGLVAGLAGLAGITMRKKHHYGKSKLRD